MGERQDPGSEEGETFRAPDADDRLEYTNGVSGVHIAAMQRRAMQRQPEEFRPEDEYID